MLIPVLLALTLLLGLAMAASLRLRMFWDVPVLAYPVFAADRFGLVPYRDLFDVNMLGTYFCHYLWGHFLGYTDFGSRVGDIVYLCFLFASIIFMLRPLGIRVGWMAAVLFGLAYLSGNRGINLQREYLFLPFLCLGTGCAMAFTKRALGWRCFFIGLCFGLVSCVKPHAAIGLLPVLAYVLFDVPEETEPRRGWIKRFVAAAGFSGAGFAIPMAFFFGYLIWRGALLDFLDMAIHYWPLYGSLSRHHSILMPGERLPYLWEQYKTLGNYSRWYLPAVFGLFVALLNTGYASRQRRYVYLIAVLTFCYSLYPVIQGQFFFYHWLPFLLFLLVLAAFNLLSPNNDRVVLARLIPLTVLAVAIYAQTDAAHRFARFFPKASDTRNEPFKRMADFLTQNLRPGDTVQPLDWVSGGVLHAMLIAEAKVATPFIYDVNFYHHVSNPYIQGLRARFIRDLKNSAPRFIIKGKHPKGERVTGPGASYSFPELDHILSEDYRVVRKEEGFTIFERRSGEASEATASGPNSADAPPAPANAEEVEKEDSPLS